MSAYSRQGRPSEDGNSIDWDAAGDADAIRAKFEALPPEVQQRILLWRPHNIDSADAEAVGIVLPAVRACVAAVQPAVQKTAFELLSPTLHMALWWREGHESLDVVAMMTPPNIDRFIKVVNADRPLRWQRSTRSSLRRIGRAINPGHHWPYREDSADSHPDEHASEDGHAISWCPNGLDIHALRAKFDALSPAVQKRIVYWKPKIDDLEDVEAFDVVLPLVRACVTAVEPVSESAVFSLRLATCRMALWWHKQFGAIDAELMLTPHNVEHFTMFKCTHLSPGIRVSMRGYLRRIGRVGQPARLAAGGSQGTRARHGVAVHLRRRGDVLPCSDAARETEPSGPPVGGGRDLRCGADRRRGWPHSAG